MNHKVTPLENGDFKVETLEEFDSELKKLRERIEFPNLKGKKC